MLALLRNQKIRGILFQLLTVIGLVAFLWYIGTNTVANIEQRGIQTGFGFLNGTAGFGIDQSPIAYSEESTHGRVFVVGLLNTLIIAFVGILCATIVGLIIGILRLSRNWLIAKLAKSYVDFFRNIPLLLQILFWYNVVLRSMPNPKQSFNFFDTIFINNRGLYFPQPEYNTTFFVMLASLFLALCASFALNAWANKRKVLTGQDFMVYPFAIGMFIVFPILAYFIGGTHLNFNFPELVGFNFKGGKTLSPEFLALTFALTIYTATFIAEAVRSGIEAVGHGQKEAAASMGFSPYQSLKLVILPQAIRIAIPPIINQYLNLIKNSSLATAVGYPEIVTVFAGTSLNQVGQAIEIISMTMLVYLIISLIVSAILNWFNHKMKIQER
ncbi:ABC transporter permease subunit [Sulfurospirillum diekertiae]|uniref:ABC transporter permease subunit n=1 Tax=Sulfurospirillum diekertiae TaxID=1854492 RepID=A0A290HST8_9BACT|nr:ABC transporter permease subunit [Sulfurospirillum diekertiae]ATB69694.1 amino acid ABC transporter, permease protein AapQ [Sulfurospirillum diekertiae]QIR74771.1 ABC transporter permease subunit [Sulfurospirillum diekertiae]QIR77434.1 ABC transporter permease subunit [Sulfurospirillum diekertiae]